MTGQYAVFNYLIHIMLKESYLIHIMFCLACVWFQFYRVKNDSRGCRSDFNMFGWFKGELILLVELILLEATICSFWLLQLILALNLLLNPFLHNISKNKSLHIQPTFIRNQFYRINSLKINSRHRRTKHTLKIIWKGIDFIISFAIENAHQIITYMIKAYTINKSR
jgi:hypothetical protein